MSSCIIIDDEYPAREELKHFIGEYSDIKIKGEFENPVEALMYIQQNKTEILFLDINMPGINGVDFARIMQKTESKPKIVFITAHREYALEAFELEAFDYLLKPYSNERIIKLLKKLENEVKRNTRNDILSVWKGDKIVILKVNEICYCESSGGGSVIHTQDESYSLNCSLSSLMKKLDENIFFKTHRAFIVNTKLIEEITPWFNNTYMVRIRGLNKDIPVSRNNMNEFKHFMGI